MMPSQLINFLLTWVGGPTLGPFKYKGIAGECTSTPPFVSYLSRRIERHYSELVVKYDAPVCNMWRRWCCQGDNVS